jgi:hypothetical protein
MRSWQHRSLGGLRKTTKTFLDKPSVQASHSPHSPREGTRKQYTSHTLRLTHSQNINIGSWKKSHTKQRTQYSRHIGEHNQTFGNTRHTEHDNEQKRKIYRVSQEEKSTFWEIIVSIILRKKVFMNMCPIPNDF